MSAAPFGFGRLWPVIPTNPDDEATPVGLAPGQMPVDPRRDGSVQPTAAGRNLSRAAGVVASGMAQGLLDAAKLPGDVYTGRVDPMSDEGRQRAFDLAGTLATGGMPMAEAGAAGIFGGRLSRTANKEALAEAQDLAAQGIGRRDIWTDTGWFQGPDRQWRHEIPDDVSRYSGRGPTLGDALDHPDAFGAYPGLARIGHSQPAALADDTLGFYYPRHRGQPERIEVAQASAGESLTAPRQHDTALHEVQHAVQAREGTLGTIDPKASASDDWFSWPEIEARNVEARRTWTDAERRSVPPWESAEQSWPQPHSRDAYPDHPMIDEANPIGRASNPPPATIADDPLAALEAMLGNLPAPAPAAKPVVRQVDPTAARWDLYHGSDAGPDFARFDPSALKGAERNSEAGALFLTPDAQQAGFYASGAPVAGAEAGPRIYRTTVEPGKTRVFDIPDLIENDVRFGDEARAALLGERSGTPTARDIASADALRNAYRDDLIASRARGREINQQLAEMGMEPGSLQAATYGHGYLGAAIKRAKAEGLDTAIIRGLEEQGGHDQVIALTPGRVRSHYAPDQLLYAGAPAAAGLAGAALSAPGDAQAAPSPSGAPMAFSLAPMSGPDFDAAFARRRGEDTGSMSLADQFSLARGMQVLAGRVPAQAAPAPVDPPASEPPAVAPFSFAGLAPRAPAQPAAQSGFGPGSLGAGLPLPPQDPASTGATTPTRAAAIQSGPSGAMSSAPLPPARPPEFGSSADPGEPLDIKPKGVAPAAAEPSTWDGVRNFLGNNSDMLIGIGTGLMSTPGFGRGLAAGVQQGVAMQQSSAAQGLARAKQAVEMQKLAREQGGITANAGLLKRAYPGVTDEQATALAATPSNVQEALKILRDPNHGTSVPSGFRMRADGQGYEPIIGGPQDPTTKEAAAAATARGTAAGKPDDDDATKREQRRQGVVSAGQDPNDPRYRDYILSGSLPKENQQALTAADKQAIREGEDSILSHQNALNQLNRALGLSPKAYEGYTAGSRAWLGSRLPDALVPDAIADREGSLATSEFDNLMSTQMLDSLKAIFGGNPTEGERAALKDIQGISGMPRELREQVIANTIAKVQSRLGFEQSRVNDLRGGTYYKPGRETPQAQPQGSTPAPAPQDPAPQGGQQPAGAGRIYQPKTPEDYAGIPSGSRFIDPQGKMRVKP